MELGGIIGEKVAEVAIEKVVGKASSIILRKVFRQPKEILLKFALIFDFYELPVLDEALQLIENSLTKYKGDNASILRINDVNFVYIISYEIEEDYLPDLDLIKPEPEEILPAEYVSLIEIILSPSMKGGKIKDKKEIERVILSGTELLDKIITALEKDEYVVDVLKIRSFVKLMIIECDPILIGDLYKKILDKLSKEKVTIRPYMDIIKRKNGRDKLVISVKDSLVVKMIMDILT